MMRIATIVTSMALLTAGLANAAEQTSPQPAAPEPLLALDTSAAADPGALDGYRAGAMAVGIAQPDGVVDHNSAQNVTTGMNWISDGSFANSSGLPTVIQNSGANVLIQSATVVNIMLK